MNIRIGQNCLLDREISEREDSDHFDAGERVVIIRFAEEGTPGPPHVLVKNRIGSQGWVDVSFLLPSRGRPMKVMV